MNLQIQPIDTSHIDALIELNRICGFPQRSWEGWNWVLFENPEQGDEPAGFVAVKDGKVHGVICGQRRTYKSADFQGSQLAAHTLVTRLEAPGTGLRLIRQIVRGFGTDAINTLNNNKLSAPIYPHFGVIPWLGSRGRVYLERALNWSHLFRSRVYNGLASGSGGGLLEAREWLESQIRPLPEIAEINGFQTLDPSDPETVRLIDAFNDTLQAGKRIHASRSADVWRYRLSDPDYSGTVRLFGHMHAGRLNTLMCVSLAKDDRYSATTLEIDDLVTLEPGIEAAVDAMKVASKLGRACGAARVRLRYPEPDLLKHVPSKWMRRARDYDCAHAMFRHDGLNEHWVPCAFDGDFFFAQRRPEKFRMTRAYSVLKSGRSRTASLPAA